MFNLFNKSEMAANNAEKNIDTLISENSRFDIKEAYNELRTNISFSIPKKGCKVICVTSAIASEGKSTTLVNNSIVFAKSGEKVLLVDCDLRKPNVNKILKISNDKGISNILVSSAEIKDVININVIENLDVITSGDIPPNPVELLSSDRMAEVISELSENYDYIFIDAPPINVVTDAALISKVCDGVMVVIRQGVVEKKFLVDAVKKLRFVNAKIIGFVINFMPNSKHGYGNYKYGSYKYGYSYGGYDKKD